MKIRAPLTICFLSVLAAGIPVSPVRAQDEREAILATVQRFFDALEKSDPELGRAAVMMDGQYFRIREFDDSVDVSRTPHTAFVRSLAEGGNDFLERMWEPTVLQRGPMAVVWTPYDFHRGGEFSHCGVDAFNLIRTNDGWKIAGIMYTVEPTGCAPSPLGPPGRPQGQ
jgi:hypothetical protein